MSPKRKPPVLSVLVLLGTVALSVYGFLNPRPEGNPFDPQPWYIDIGPLLFAALLFAALGSIIRIAMWLDSRHPSPEDLAEARHHRVVALSREEGISYDEAFARIWDEEER